MRFLSTILLVLFLNAANADAQESKLTVYSPDHTFIQYTGRIDFTNPKLPRFWQPGVYISFQFTGNECWVMLNDEMLWGSNNNYLELIIDNKAYRIQTKAKINTIDLSGYLSDAATHTVTICKNTEANIGYLELAGISCKELIRPAPKPKRKIECIGNSITCGASSDMSQTPCGKGKWQDQHNAWFSYGAVAARDLNAQFHLSSVSGIGLMRSCCNMNIIMPQVFDKVSMRNDSIQWNFDQYQPDIVTVCLGQNDGLQDFVTFRNNYLVFLKKLRGYYPNADIVLLTSPMANGKLKNFMSSIIAEVQQLLKQTGDQKIYTYVFQKQYIGGCDYHPSLEEHRQIADELIAFINKTIKW